MPNSLDAIEFPELIIGVAGPIGVDVTAVTESLEACLKEVAYTPHTIKLTTEMKRFPLATPLDQAAADFYHDVMHKIGYANALRRQEADAATLARLALKAIRNLRGAREGGSPNTVDERGCAYILRQLKRPEEVELLRKIYGKQFILVSVYGSVDSRRKLIEDKLKRSLSTRTSAHQISSYANELIETDADEKDEDFGQRLRETFHLGDVFVDGIRRQDMDKTITRFVQAVFGRNDISPSKAEYGMYTAKSASLRSADLSRQVGAAIFTDDGELLAQGCNEVPKAFGGTYWDSEDLDYRDIRHGQDPNEMFRRELLRDLFERLLDDGWLSEKAVSHGSPDKMVDAATAKSRKTPDVGRQEAGPLAAASVMDLTEYGRIVHAEMCAICDAARVGRAIKGATLYCTTFPCHNCTKHILASGLKKVIYIEPYPKSKAKDLHENEISIDGEDETRVSFTPFLGISPSRYRDLFQKGKRKNQTGQAERWYQGRMRPMIDILAPFYIETEAQEAVKVFGRSPAVGSSLVPPGNSSDEDPIIRDAPLPIDG